MNDQTIVLVIDIVLFVFIFIPTMVAFLSGAPWVPTPMARVKKMLELADIKPGETVYDIGCGDGRMVITASKEFGAKGVGVELSPLLYFAARIRNFLTRGNAKFLLRDLRYHSLADADVVMFYLMPETLKKLTPKFAKELKPGARLISYAFSVGDWVPVHIEPKNAEKNLSRILVFRVPDSIPTSASLTAHAETKSKKSVKQPLKKSASLNKKEHQVKKPRGGNRSPKPEKKTQKAA